jgi:hypothetical protein
MYIYVYVYVYIYTCSHRHVCIDYPFILYVFILFEF